MLNGKKTENLKWHPERSCLVSFHSVYSHHNIWKINRRKTTSSPESCAFLDCSLRSHTRPQPPGRERQFRESRGTLTRNPVVGNRKGKVEPGNQDPPEADVLLPWNN